MTTEVQVDNRYHIRYQTVGHELPIAIQRVDDDTPVFRGKLLDISRVGVRLATKTPVRFNEDLLLHIDSEASGFRSVIAARVQWIRKGRTEDEMIIACAFESQLDPSVLEDLVAYRCF